MASLLENLFCVALLFVKALVGLSVDFMRLSLNSLILDLKCIIETQNASELIQNWVIEAASLKKHFEFPNAIKLVSLLLNHLYHVSSSFVKALLAIFVHFMQLYLNQWNSAP